MDQLNPPIDPNSGFNKLTSTFHSLRPPIDLPSEHTPISATDYAFSLRVRLNSPWPDSLALINSSTGQRVSYSDFTRRTQTLASYFQSVIGLTKGDTAFVLSQNLIQVPILYFSLLSLKRNFELGCGPHLQMINAWIFLKEIIKRKRATCICGQ